MTLIDHRRIAVTAGREERTPFHAVLRVDGDSVWIDLVGEFDVAAALTLDAVVDSLEELDRVVLCVDLAQVTLMDAGGLSALVGADRRLRARGSRLKLLRPSERVRWLLDVAVLGDLVMNGPPVGASNGRSGSGDAFR